VLDQHGEPRKVKRMTVAWQLAGGGCCRRAQSVPMHIIPSVSYLADETGGYHSSHDNHGADDHSLDGGRGVPSSHLGCLYTILYQNRLSGSLVNFR
jgi:hypothetical protein